MFLDHSELWIWRAVQGWERKTGDRTLAWQTEGPRFNTAKGKENCADVKHQCVRWVRKSQKGIKCRGDVMMQGQSREGSPGPSTSHSLRSPAPGSLTGDHRNYLRCLFRGRTKASTTTSITVTWVCLKEDRRKSSCWPDDPEALWHLLQSCTGDRETDSGK